MKYVLRTKKKKNKQRKKTENPRKKLDLEGRKKSYLTTVKPNGESRRCVICVTIALS